MKTVFIVLDHGLGVGYFFQTGLAQKLKESGIRSVYLLQDAEFERRKKSRQESNIIYESLREKECLAYQRGYYPGIQELFEYIRRTITSRNIPLTYVKIRQRYKEFEAKGRRKLVLTLLRPIISILRYTKLGRRVFLNIQRKLFSPSIYSDLFDKYHPSLVISDSAGWRLDQYILREANKRKIKTATAIVGWDNPGSAGMPGANIDYVNVWSEIHKWEMSQGVDIPQEKILIGGMPLYDGYINKQWLLSKKEYFALHNLDTNKKVIAFAATALSATPNLPTIKILAKIVNDQLLKYPTQLLVRLHPSHFKAEPAYQQEAKGIFDLANSYENVHIVEPVETPGGLERYSGEDFPEKASMLTHSDALVTIYSTMVIEAALNGTPCINAVIPSKDGWETKFWVPMHEIPGWPTPVRIDNSGAAKRVESIEELVRALNNYLDDPSLDKEGRDRFLSNELTFLDGTSTQITTKNLLLFAKHPN